MKKEKVIYAITSEDVVNVSNEINISTSSEELPFIKDKVGDFFGSQWHDAVEYALIELKNNREMR